MIIMLCVTLFRNYKVSISIWKTIHTIELEMTHTKSIAQVVIGYILRVSLVDDLKKFYM